jgi:hypothetical protein
MHLGVGMRVVSVVGYSLVLGQLLNDGETSEMRKTIKGRAGKREAPNRDLSWMFQNRK